jgi:nucleoid-associated protein YgaU
MTAMRAVELPEAPAAEVPAIAAAAQPGENAVGRAATRWARPGQPAGPRSAAPLSAAPLSAGPLTVEFQAAGVHVTGTAPGGQAASVPLRLTSRGRVVVAVTAVLLLAVLSLIVAMSAEATNQAPARTAPGLTQVIVRPGQSLWSVAEKADPDADTRVVIQRITELNGLTGSAVFAGQRLWVPRG